MKQLDKFKKLFEESSAVKPFSFDYDGKKLDLSSVKGVMERKNDRQFRMIYDVIPNGGSVLMMLLVFVKFVKSIEKQAIPQMITILGVFIGVELVLGYLKIEYKDLSKKKALWLEIATYASLVIFFFCCMIISVDFGKI